MRQPPIPNRLVETPNELYKYLENVVVRNPYARLKDYWVVIRMAYSRGYRDGYRDGHTDAENGHDERVRAKLA